MNAATSVGTFELRFAHRPLLPNREPTHFSPSLAMSTSKTRRFPPSRAQPLKSDILNHNR